MGLTFLAAGGCMPEAISSCLAIRKGKFLFYLYTQIQIYSYKCKEVLCVNKTLIYVKDIGKIYVIMPNTFFVIKS